MPSYGCVLGEIASGIFRMIRSPAAKDYMFHGVMEIDTFLALAEASTIYDDVRADLSSGEM